MNDRRDITDRIVDIATVVLISLAAVGTAWCSYQSARWNALQSFDYTKANEARTESVQWASRGNAHRTVHIIVFVDYQRALVNDPAFATFLWRRFDAPLKTAVTAWLKTDPLHSAVAPPTPFAMSAYHLMEDDRSAAASRLSDALVTEGSNAEEQADQYLFQTVLFASASFLGGIALKLRPPGHVVATAVGFAIFLFALLATLRYPIR